MYCLLVLIVEALKRNDCHCPSGIGGNHAFIPKQKMNKAGKPGHAWRINQFQRIKTINVTNEKGKGQKIL